MKHWATVFLMILCALRIAHADRIDNFVKEELATRRIPGISISVMKNGVIVKAQGYGYSNLEHMVPAKPETIYQSGSIGKQFTATAVMILVEEGRVGLDDPITKYFPDGPDSWKNVKVRHLLSHTGGISNKLYDEINMREDYSEDQILKKIESMPLDFNAGDQWNYSNPGYVLLGILIHKVTGKFYGDFLQERIFRPLGMTTTRIISEADIIPNRAAGYVIKKGVLRNQEWVAPMINTTADGSLYFTVLDLAKWDAALYGEKLLKRSNLEQMWTPTKLNDGKVEPYGFGWGFDDIRKHKIIDHGGSWQGFNTYIARYVDDKLTVVVLCNLDGANPGSIAHGIAGLYNPELAPLPHKEVKIDSKLLDQYTGEYEVEPGYTIVLTNDNGHLMGQASEGPQFELFPESEKDFFIKAEEISITFVKDTNGKVTHMVLHRSKDQEARKIR